jgi:adenylate cyclase
MAMPIEIERKFLVRSDAWRSHVVTRKKLRQGYLAQNDRTSVRIRITDETSALLTVKSRDTGRRLEFEYPIPCQDAITLLELREGSVISKVRHIVPAGNLKWEIDVFEDDNRGLVVAEIELPSMDYPLTLPEWVGAEVTHDGRYYNSHLVLHPFSSWPHRHSGAALERQYS